MTHKEQLAERNQEIGQLLQQARGAHHLSVTACAQLLGTSRRRYNDIEQGFVPITLAELELLLPFLGLPVQQIWPDVGNPVKVQQVIVAARPGDTVQVVFAVR